MFTVGFHPQEGNNGGLTPALARLSNPPGNCSGGPLLISTFAYASVWC